MTGWRTLVSLVVVLAVVDVAQAQTYSLSEAPLGGSCYRVELHLDLSGEMTIQQEGKTIPLKESATAAHEYLERVLQAAEGGTAEKTARVYKTARVVINVGDDRSERTLRPERCLVVAQRVGEQLVTFCPKGPFTREELEVTDHFDTLTVTGLLPAKEVAVGETWKVANPTAQTLCHLEGLISQDLTCKLEQVKDNIALIAITGTVSGVDMGATVKVTVRGSCKFDTKARRLTHLEWKQSDQREQGPISPASTAEVAIKLVRTPVEQPSELSDIALVPVPTKTAPPESMMQMSYSDPKGRFEMVHGREWYRVGVTEQHLVLRLMDRGAFVAQATIAPWKKAEPGKHLSEEEFKQAVAAMPGWKEEKLLPTESSPNKEWVYRIAAEGQLEGVRALQYFYLLAAPQGDQMLVTFTLTPAQAQQLGARDMSLILITLAP